MTDKDDSCPCGSTKKYKHCCQRKEKKPLAAPAQSSAMVPTWMQLAMQNLRQERLQQAKVLYEQVLQAKPHHAEALQWLGVINHKQGNSARALDLVREAIAASPANAFAYSTLGNVQKDLKQYDASISSFQKALSLKPDFAEAHNNLGVAFAAQGHLAAAVASYRKATALIPSYTEAWNNLGAALQAQGQTHAAIEAYRGALACNPSHAHPYFNLGSVLSEGAPEQAVIYLQKAVWLNPQFSKAWIALAKILSAQGELDQAGAAYARSQALESCPGVAIQRALMLAPIMGTLDEVQVSRRKFEENLAVLHAQNLRIVDPLKECCDTNFHLAYHGYNDRDVQMHVAQFYAKVCPELMYVAPHCERPRNVAGKKRIGFLSKFITQHSVALSFSRIIAALSADGEFEVALLSQTVVEQEALQEAYPNFAGKYVRVPGDLEQARQSIAALQLDVLVYLDIGAFSYFLAFARLAHVQCVVGGHPVTTGIPAMDYFLSADSSEVEHAQDHYSEKLVRLPFGAFYFERPALPTTSKTRLELGLPENGSIYACPMTLHKLHPDFDAAIERILQLDPTGYVVLFADKKFSSWQRQLERRFALTISGEVIGRVIFAPWVVDKQDFMRTMDAADVVLDPFHFGMGTTAIPICAVGTPFVTKPSEFMRGRVGLYYCKLMGLMECVTEDLEGYAAKAVSLARNASERQRIKNLMLANNHVLFQNERGIEDVSNFLARVAAPN